ncbi:MAG: cell envelope biogenesis protein OmpA [Alphaproteobacteria bacterium CG11_big_fil_rev_8_21_14_0_20_39_49]|nr:MAG: cell envelope biogenesis protein OmpA [Alphaproteobacteria bacterium CG11_big_fil_rev_8_21_14_0_20_39_49]
MKYFIIILAGLSLLLQGCTQNAYTGQSQASKTSIGAGIGAGVGVLAGVLSADNAKDRRKNALIGAGIGAAAGGGAGYFMDRQEAELRQTLQNTGVSVTRNGKNITLNMPGNITFDTNQSNIKPEFYGTLNSIAIVLKKFNQTGVRVDGHTDSTGSDSHNLKLSQDRASSVAQYLASQGIGYNRLSSQGFGESSPIAANNTDAGRSANRRVEIQLFPL